MGPRWLQLQLGSMTGLLCHDHQLLVEEERRRFMPYEAGEQGQLSTHYQSRLVSGHHADAGSCSCSRTCIDRVESIGIRSRINPSTLIRRMMLDAYHVCIEGEGEEEEA